MNEHLKQHIKSEIRTFIKKNNEMRNLTIQ